MPCIGSCDGADFRVNGIVHTGIRARLVKLMSTIDNLPGPGHMTVVTADGRQSKYTLPVSDIAARSLIHARLGNAMVIGGGASFRLHIASGQELLYGVMFGAQRWQGCTSEQVRLSYLTCACCGEQAGTLLENEVCCDWPTACNHEDLPGGRR